MMLMLLIRISELRHLPEMSGRAMNDHESKYNRVLVMESERSMFSTVQQ